MVSNCCLFLRGTHCLIPASRQNSIPIPTSSHFLFFLFSFSPHSSTPLFCSIYSHSLSLLLSVPPSLRPLRAAGSGRSLLRRSELITCILDRRATWGHTLPEDRSIHAGGNRGTGARGLKPGARSRVGAGSLNRSRSKGGNGLYAGIAAA